MSSLLNIYTADFETRASETDITLNSTSVWLADICSLSDLSHRTFNTIDDFFNHLYTLPTSIIYFHNLKFDGEFLLHYLHQNHYTFTTEKHLSQGEYTALITDRGVWYSLKVCLYNPDKRKRIKIEFRDSLKKINATVEKIAKDFDLPIKKGSIDYTLYRPIDYIPTDEEIDYIRNDTEIMSRALRVLYENGNDRLTSASDTMKLYKQKIGKIFKLLFPVVDLTTDDFIRNSYRGGLVQCNEKLLNTIIPNVSVYDINSMYPHKMLTCELPYDKPIYYQGQYTADPIHPLFIQRIEVCCSVKSNHRPTVLLKNLQYFQREYLISTNYELIELTLTSIDLDLLFTHYDIYDIIYLDGYKFKSSSHLFDKFVPEIYEKKCNSKGALKALYKIYLNSLYGKFASSPYKGRKLITFTEDKQIKYINSEIEIDKPVYTAVASFITAYSRKQILQAIHDNLENFIYCDTDSVHVTGNNFIGEVSDNKLGAFAFEKLYIEAKYIGQKAYFGITSQGKRDIKLAGCPDIVKTLFDFSTFKISPTQYHGKLRPKRVTGGIILVDTPFTIKERKHKSTSPK